MTRLFCQDDPEILTLNATVVRTRPGAVLLSRHPFYPGGGGQLPDKGVIRWQGGEAPVTGFCEEGSSIWIEIAGGLEIAGDVQVAADPVFRQLMLMRELHTDLHILNALVFRDFDGALVTGVQMNEDGTARIDFDLPDADNDRLRALEPELNDVVAQDLAVETSYVSMTAAHAEKGLLRSRSVAPPPSSEGLIRIVEIAGLDRQACGGTHLGSTGASRPIRILKIENKGRSNRRVRIGLQGL
ncbi:alanyl-tRNA editing protein [Variovorax sp. WS11]|uniref:alanyl-tRNA editing protein n=1 Tax=Variovorax sp. WS11 TaxID=1105204 RepID=UPI000D0DAAC9|nr:alanyl-tRNA editing protein [Variovorax sp. WS11]NDZ17591.1 alanyl-tRNA editing protein [Variovorax sp. WS11]PSL82204.1 alanyl-tRNA editing protein [Variovorax sp. WS11]